jgi:protein CMS1
MDNQLLADHLAQKLSRFGSDLSAVEISDLTVSGNAEIPSRFCRM